MSSQNHGPSSLVVVACVTGWRAGGLRANPSAVDGGRQELPSWGRMGDAAVDPGIAQHIPEEEKEEEAEAAEMLCLAHAPNELCCLAEGDLDADSGMSHSQEWTLALPAHFEQVKTVPWEVPRQPL